MKDQRKTKAQLSDELARLRGKTSELESILDAIPDAVMIIGPDHRIRRVNAAAAKTFGMSPEELEGRPCFELAHGTSAPPPFCPHSRTLADREKHESEFYEPTLGKHYQVTTTPAPGPDGQPRASVHIMRDVTERFLARETLRASEQKFRNIVASLPLGFHMYELQDDGRLIFCQANPAAEKILGFDHTPLLGRTLEEAFPDNAGREAPEIYRRLARDGGEPVGLESYAYQDEQIAGVFEILFFQVAPGFSGALFREISERKRLERELEVHRERLEELVESRTVEVRDVIRELTAEAEERKRAEDRVLAERQRFMDVLETLPLYLCLLAPDYHMPFANRYFRETFGESHGRRCYEFLFERAEPCETCESYTALRTRLPHHWEWIGPNGRNYDVHDYPFKDSDGSTIILEMGIDVTERKRAEEKLRQSEASLTEAQRIAHLGNWDWNIETNGLAWSDEIYRIFGLTPREFGATYDAFLNSVHPDDRDAVVAAVNAAVSEGRPYGIEHRIVLPGGEVRVVHERGEVFFDEAGKAARMIGTVQDITEWKRAEAAREAAEQELERQRTLSIHADRLRSLGEMAAGIAHELNQPLMGIRNMAEHLVIGIRKGWAVTPESVSEKAGAIVEQVDRMSHVIEHSRVFARGGGEELELKLVSVNDAVNDALSLVRAQLKSRGIALRLELAPELPRVMVNPFSLEEVVLNLINNARDACQEMLDKQGGSFSEVRVRTFTAGEGPSRTVHVEVLDQGPGMSEEVRARAFEPFYSTKPPDRGTGLGLSICRAIVERFQGTISIESKPGEGARVTVSFPAEG